MKRLLLLIYDLLSAITAPIVKGLHMSDIERPKYEPERDFAWAFYTAVEGDAEKLRLRNL